MKDEKKRENPKVYNFRAFSFVVVFLFHPSAFIFHP